MELIDILRRLRALRGALLIAAAIAVLAGVLSVNRLTTSPPFLEKKSLEYGAASTELLIDSSRSSVGNAFNDLAPFASRANIFAAFLQSDPIREEIAREVGVSPNTIQIEGAANVSETRNAGEPGQAERSNALLYEGIGYRIALQAKPELPLVTMNTEAPNARQAVRLADGAAAGVSAYLTKIQNRDRIPQNARVVVRQLGKARGGTVNRGGSMNTAFVTAIGSFVLLAILILLGDRARVELRRSAERAKESSDEPVVQNGHVPDEAAEELARSTAAAERRQSATVAD